MALRSIKDASVKERVVLLRVDFNVPLKDGRVVNDFRIQVSLPTIKHLVKKGAKIVLLTHLGRPQIDSRDRLIKGQKKKYTLKPIASYLAGLLKQPVFFETECLGKEVQQKVSQLQPGEILLLENLRFYPGEKENQDSFARQLAALGEIYVNDAFGVVHRSHASVVGLPRYLPSYAGLLLVKEINVLTQISHQAQRPLVVVIGGIKISTKIKVIKEFLRKADNLILGGALANTVIRAKGFAIGRSFVEESMVKEVQQLNLTETKLHLPVDVIVSTDTSGKAPVRVAAVGKTSQKEMILDIGPDTVYLFKEIISKGKTVIWNGPMGLFEVPVFSRGSQAIAEALSQHRGFTLAGGGDTISLLSKFNLIKKISHVCSGGGAMLKFLAGESLPGLKALNKS